MTLENSTTQVAGSPFAAPEFLPGLYRANPAQTDVFADGLYRLEFIKGGASLNPPVYDTYQLRGGQEAALAPVTTDSASRAASQNDLSLIATTVQVNAARDAVIDAPAFTTGDRATLTALSTRASEERLINLETVARDATAADYRATGFATVNPDNTTIGRLGALLTGDFTRFSTTALSNAPTSSGGGGGLTTEQATQLAATATTAQVNAARDAVIAAPAFTASDRTTLDGIATRASEVRLVNLETVARDSTAADYRATGFSTPAQVTAVTTAVNAARDNVNTNTNTARDAVLLQGNTAWTTGLTTPQQTQLNTIQTLATIATEPITNLTVIDQTAKTYTVYQADGVTPRVVKDLKNATGAASSEAVYSEIPRP
jgi:hypothetical protein